MNNIQTLADKTAIGLSLLCTIHCLFMPLVVLLLPSLTALPLADEAFHTWMIYGVLPISMLALTMGCKRHGYFRLLIIGAIGLAILVVTVLLGHEMLGEFWEKSLTVLGSSIIALGHFWNYRLCQQRQTQEHENCECAEHNS